jgi:tetratricopeptide (TPR) repeat protein
MDIDPQISIIAAYLDGELTEKQRKDFEERLITNTAFQEEFQRYKAASMLLEESASLRLKEKMRELEKKQKGYSRKIWWLPYAAAAAIALLLISSFFYFSSQGNLSSEEVIREYFEPYPASRLRGAAKMEDPFNQGLSAYMSAEYGFAISALEQIRPQQNEYIEAQMYLGNAYLATGKYPEAISALSKVFESGDSRFSEAATWYLLLGYVATGNKEQFEKFSAKILNSDRLVFKKEVEELQRKWEGE